MADTQQIVSGKKIWCKALNMAVEPNHLFVITLTRLRVTATKLSHRCILLPQRRPLLLQLGERTRLVDGALMSDVAWKYVAIPKC